MPYVIDGSAELETQLLIDNPINRYLINSPILPQMKRSADGSLTLYIQKDSSGHDARPTGCPIYIVMRLYWPKVDPPSILPAGKRHLESAGNTSRVTT